MGQINYTPVGDILTIIITWILFSQLTAGHTRRNAGYRSFLAMVACIFISSISNVSYYMVSRTSTASMQDLAGALYSVRYITLYGVQFFNVYYLARLVFIKGRELKLIRNICFGVLVLLSAVEIGTKLQMHFAPADSFLKPTYLFGAAFIFYTGWIFYILIRNRSRIVHLVYGRLIITYLFCILIRTVQGSHNQTSFTTAIYLLPVLQIMYFLHQTPFDANTNAFDEYAFDNTVRTAYRKNEKLILACLHLYDFTHLEELPENMRFDLYHFFSGDVHGAELFRVQHGRLILVIPEKKNPAYSDVLNDLTNSFRRLYDKYQADYRIVIVETCEALSKDNEYLPFLQFIEPRIALNSIHMAQDADISAYTRQQYVISQLEDIAARKDLNDPRVLAYCQPVFNVTTKIYDTAEALMRITLPETGMLYPDQFISLAETRGILHPLSLIILNKTCQTIRKLTDDGKLIKRVSVNFSIEQLRLSTFCDDIIQVIRDNQVPFDKIAIELTESQNETDFELVRDKIHQLKEYGITFYLDDFGTGYSNMERIMELPFDIIKFDRSMVIESALDKNSEFMVNSFADMFRKLDYDVLYEGVETDTDEQRCIRMLAGYLQGYKYSRPIDITNLVDFLSPIEDIPA
ncbi:MAG: EAL domain-containing protein [Lachnospiraceae bacterium]|nr:EAL domain-containing protein [Lachnospiraceae bacterium]